MASLVIDERRLAGALLTGDIGWEDLPDFRGTDLVAAMVFWAGSRLHYRGDAINLLTVAAELHRANGLHLIGGPEALAELL